MIAQAFLGKFSVGKNERNIVEVIHTGRNRTKEMRKIQHILGKKYSKLKGHGQNADNPDVGKGNSF